MFLDIFKLEGGLNGRDSLRTTKNYFVTSIIILKNDLYLI